VHFNNNRQNEKIILIITDNLPRSGLPCKISSSGVKIIIRTVSKNPRTTQGNLMCQACPPAYASTCLKFAREHMDDPEEDWENIMWSDKTKLELFGKNNWLSLEEKEC
ncbi:hypothetical protein NFI96_013007, partial [Prochilodus magdalenae]